MKRFGLTGGIATGKSTVSRMFAEHGVPIVDADLLAREAVAPGSIGLQQIAERFPGVVVDGVLDRKKLGERIFNDAGERAALNAITHPEVRRLAGAAFARLDHAGHRFAIYDVPLLIESKMQGAMDGVILVAVPPAVQLQRLIERDGLSLEQARARLASQLPIDSKRPFATWVIENGGDLDATRAQVETVLAALTV